jgi:urease accessory protein
MQIMRLLNLSSVSSQNSRLKSSSMMLLGGVATSIAFMAIATPAFAHHPFGADTPSNALEGFLSGVGHPVIGFDHFAFVIASGLIAALFARGFVIPVAFVLMSMVGTGIHLMSIDLPMPEVIISASVLLFGFLLALKKQPSLGVVTALGAIAGVFHGHAYGEAVFGAEMTPIVAYLAGFATIQVVIALASFFVGRRVYEQRGLALRFSGFAIAGFGAAFLASALLG